jgi:hypothetical protein
VGSIEIRAAPPRVWEVLLARIPGEPTLRQPYVRLEYGALRFRLRVNPRGTLVEAEGAVDLAPIKEEAEKRGFPSSGMVGSEGGATT